MLMTAIGHGLPLISADEISYTVCWFLGFQKKKTITPIRQQSSLLSKMRYTLFIEPFNTEI